MEIRVLLKYIMAVALMIIVAFLLQTSVFSHLELAGIVPNFMIMLTTAWGLMRGRREGMVMGFFCGLLLDLFSGLYIGFYAVIFLYIGYLSGVFRKMFFGDDLKLPLVLIGVNDILYGLVIYLLYFLLRKRYAFGYYFLNIILPEAVYTVLVSLFAYYLIYKVNQWLEKDNKRSTHHLV
jgi:rod shape-determining protein MreD